jgi:hypothetical protein
MHAATVLDIKANFAFKAGKDKQFRAEMPRNT